MKFSGPTSVRQKQSREQRSADKVIQRWKNGDALIRVHLQVDQRQPQPFVNPNG